MELNGALSNPRVVLEIQRTAELRQNLLGRSTARPVPDAVTARPGAVSDVVVTVLALAGRPMRACEVHRACEELTGGVVRWGTVKNVLSSSAARHGMIRRLSYGTYVHRDGAST